MKNLFVITLMILFTYPSWAVPTHCRHDKNNLRCVKFISNYDADTLTMEIPRVHPLLGHRAKVRVYGVDAPEMTSENPCEREKARLGKKMVTQLLAKAKRINLENVAREKYFRILANVTVDGQSLSQYLLQQGLAVQYLGGTKPVIDWCQDLVVIAGQNTTEDGN